MADDYTNIAGNYLSSTRSVLQAAVRLRSDLGAGAARRGFAITQLEQAAEQQQGGASGFRSFMFSELETTVEPNRMIQERAAEETLASISADLHVASVLIAAGETVGETGSTSPPRLLDEAIVRLTNTTQAIDQSLTQPSTGQGRFGFADDAPSQQVKSLPDLASATASFRKRSDEVLTTFLSEAQGAIGDVVETLSSISGEKVLEALSKLGGALEALPKVGRLIRQGIKKLETAVNALVRLMGSDALVRIKDKVQEFWEEAKKGKPLQVLLMWAFGVEEAQAHVADALRTYDQLKAVDEGRIALERLPTMFKETMDIVKSLAVIVTLTSTLLSMVPAIGPNAMLVAASIDVLILASIILIGRDYTDAGDILRRVRGVGEIADGVRSA